MPLRRSDKIWMDGELVDWDDAKIHVLTHTLHYGCGVFEGIRAYATAAGPGRVPPHRPHRRGCSTRAKIFMIDIPFTRRAARRGDQGDGAGQRARRVLHPPDRRTSATARWASTRCRARSTCRSRCGRGALPRRRGHQARRADEDLVVAAPRPQRHAARGQGHRHVHQLVDGQGRGAEGRLRRGDPAVTAGLRRASAPARTSSSCKDGAHHHAAAVGAARSRASRSDSVHDDRPRPRLSRCEVGNILRSDLYTADEAFLTGTAAEVVPIRSVDDREIGEPGPDHPQASRRRTSPPCAARSTSTRTGSNMSDDLTYGPADRARRDLRHDAARRQSQLEGISLTVDDKLRIAEQLDWLGVDYIEGGWPGANPKDDEFFRRAPSRAAARRRSTLVAFGSTRRARRQGRLRRHAAPPASRPARRHGVHRRQVRGTTTCSRRCETTLDEGVAMVGRLGRVPARRRAARCSSTPSTSSTATSATPSSACACSRRPREAGADAPRAVRHQRRLAARTRSSASSARSSPTSAPTSASASTSTTTPAAAWPTRWPACAAAPSRCRARSTATASAPATATSRRSSPTSR